MYGYLGGAGGGSFWDLFVGNAYALMIQMPIEIISVAILAIAIVVAGFTKHRIPLLVATVLVICLVSLATMIRQPVPRYFVPMLPLVALGLTWLMGELRPQSPSNVAIALSRRIVLPAILALVGANTFASIASWASEVASQHVDTLAFEREISLQGDCYLMRSDDQLTGIFFGSSWARSDWIKSVLDKNYPNFIIYNHNGSRLLSDFSGALTPEKIEGKIKSLGKGLCGVFNDAWTAKLDVDFYEILGHRNGLTGVRVREPIAP
jgi:hypothetical protein